MKKVFLMIMLLSLTNWLFGQKPVVYSTEDGAIGGYDPVAYFTEGKPVKGVKELTQTYDGAIWHFSSAKNQQLFQLDPGKYAPQFGGYCAFGMSRGYKAETQPDAWTIVNGRLFMNYNLKVREEWGKKQTEYIIKANENWLAVKAK